MWSRGWLAGCGSLLLVGLSGCAPTDDYYIEAGDALSEGGSSTAGDSMLITGGSQTASGGSSGAGVVAAACTPTIERCNGHDDDCDELVDELACNSMMNGTVGCSGFVLSADPTHGYMLCTGTKDYAHARDACVAQNMRLAWLETEAENAAVAKKVAALSKDAEVSFGATDAAKEGEWFWDGGVQFWSGNETGMPVGGLFDAWMDGTPNNENNDEDCAVLMSGTATWGDRPCSAKYSYLCEEGAP